MASTTAEQIASQLGNDGLNFRSVGGADLSEMAEADGADVTYARLVRVDVLDEDGDLTGREEEHMQEVARSDIHDRVRYAFDDGSAIVVAGDAWDVEGVQPFSWAGA